MTASNRLPLSSVCLSLAVCAAAAFGAPARTLNSPAAPIENSVVKVFATMRYPDPFRPWTKQAPSEVSASGVVIEGKRILTNAHVVLYATQVQIQANAAGDKVPATVLAAAPGIDLAVLQLDDPSFFDTHPAVVRASQLPQIKDAVLAYGFPTGGTSLSITKGIVSRIEFVSYNFPVSGLRIQVDAAINPGNSGGPAIAGDKMIGLAFSKLGGDTQNIGYIIPNEEVDLFLKDIADGHYDGKPAMYDDLQTLENPALREYLKLDKSVEGMVVHRPYKTDASYPLKEWDVITHIGDTPIDNQGMIKLDKDLRVSFGYLIQRLAKDGKLPLTVVRAGKVLQIQLPVSAEHPTLVTDLQGRYPSYFIYGPLVFSTATWQLVSSVENNAGMLRALGFVKSPLVTRALDPPDADLDELVVVSSPFFPHKLANGYSNPAGSVVYTINGTRIRSLRQLVALLRDLKDPFVTIEFDQKGGEALVFSRQAVMAATDEILTDNGVRAQGSPDTLAVWQAKSAD
ncbi:MAG: trypsin-like peptidase domain-containing protein [Steroidobacteraceae bacterium]